MVTEKLTLKLSTPLFFTTCLALTSGLANAAVTYTCDASIDVRVPGLCNTLNTTIADLYSKTFTNASAQIFITFGTTGLGSSAQYLNYVTWAQYLTALNGRATASGNAVQKAALTALATYAAPLYSNGNVEITAALGRSLGFAGMTGSTKTGDACNAGTSGCFDAVVTITKDPNTPLYFRTGTEAPNAYDFFGTVEHETNEVLGISSCIDTTGTVLTNSCNRSAPAAIDLFRYSAVGKIVAITSLSTAPGAYFSYDGGITNGANGIAYNTLSNGSDYHDFAGVCPGKQHIQDAEGCPGKDANMDITNDGGAEINTLNALGYTLVPVVISNVPAVSTGGVVAHGTGSTTIQPGSWVDIYGTNLAATSRFWNADTEIINGNLPTSLDGVSVKINNKPAYVYYISPGQINVQAPDDSATGTVNVTVTNANGTSTSTTATLQSVGPALFTLDGKYPAGVIPVSTGFYFAGTPFAYDLLGPNGFFPFNTQPAKKGDVVELFATGFGSASPAVPAGKVVTVPSKTTSPVTVLIGGVAQTVDAYIVGAGVFPQNVASGDNTLRAIVNGVQTVAGTVITVK